MRLLLVEDQPDLSAMLGAHFAAQGFEVAAARSGADALAALSGRATFNLAVLDLGLPDMDGMAVLTALRGAGRGGVPTLILTARDALESRVAGLDAGADDYMLKPFELPELDARLRALLRRPGIRKNTVYAYADLSFCAESRRAAVRDTAVDLTPREAVLFEALVRAGESVSVRDALIEGLFPAGDDVTPNALEAVVSRLRRKLAALGATVQIETVRGLGYRLARASA